MLASHVIYRVIYSRNAGNSSSLSNSNHHTKYKQGSRAPSNMVFLGMGIPIIKVRRSHNFLIFIMGIPKLVKIYLDIEKTPGGRLNKKDGLTRYGDSHVKDKTS